jgi:glycosyltransferase involved in cell wall biosynthesis
MTRPIHILEFGQADGAGGGPEKTILNGAALADPRRFQTTICYIRRADDQNTYLKERAEDLRLDYHEIRQANPLFDPNLLPALRRLVRDRGIDLVHSHGYKPDLLALQLARKEGVAILSTVHGWTGHLRRERWVYYPANKWLLKSFPLVLTVSAQIRKELIWWGAAPDRVRVLLNGIDPAIFRKDPRRVAEARSRFGIEPGELVIGAAGRLEPQKRFDLLLRAFATLRLAHPALRLLIAGEGSRREALAGEIERLRLRDSVRLLGHCGSMVDFFHAIDRFVQSSDYEGTSNAVLEAMALEVPIVATDVGGTAELVAHEVHGMIIPPGDPDHLAAAIDRTLKEPALTAQWATQARHRVESELSFAMRCRKLETIYEGLLASRTAPGALAEVPV